MSTYDAIIIGGGVTGLGVGYEAIKRQKKVLVIEKGRCGEGNSQNSHRIIHGGFRYLKSLNFNRVIEGIHAKSELIRTFPKAVVELPCVMPTGTNLQGRHPLQIAATTYNILQRKIDPSLQPTRLVSKDWTAENLSQAFALEKGGLLWFDGYLRDHNALVKEIVRFIKTSGSEVLEEMEVRRVLPVRDYWCVETSEGAFCGHRVVNAAGASIDEVDAPHLFSQQVWVKAFNLVLKKSLQENFAIAIPSAKRGFLFISPREKGRSALGTAYLPCSKTKTFKPNVSKDEILDFIADYNLSVPSVPLSIDDVEDVEKGILPVQRFQSGTPTFFGSTLIKERSGYIEILSTKYTTFLSSGRKVAINYL